MKGVSHIYGKKTLTRCTKRKLEEIKMKKRNRIFGIIFSLATSLKKNIIILCS
mgnify:CR=1 FL=1